MCVICGYLFLLCFTSSAGDLSWRSEQLWWCCRSAGDLTEQERWRKEKRDVISSTTCWSAVAHKGLISGQLTFVLVSTLAPSRSSSAMSGWFQRSVVGGSSSSINNREQQRSPSRPRHVLWTHIMRNELFQCPRLKAEEDIVTYLGVHI